ncbi:hypothetical protein LGQ02_01880 [Bacillus shivajii]|uniref:hypothetical protein n=1 Tax=Bacillus shivajii TaxID=1983719 RepID=UPI001CFA2075|nr:hypothetical protein [Bacillus shivajii]UCZ53571.1 hypothetical protein LGQ02_01880 [Bacillus shivajii]
MLTDLNEKLKLVKEKQRKKQKWTDHLKRAEHFLIEEKNHAAKLKAQLEKEKEDVERLESFSLTNVFYSLTGRKLEKLDEEKQAVLSAKLKYTEAKETVEDLEKEIAEYESLLKTVADSGREYRRLLAEKEDLIHDSNSPWSIELYALSEEEAELQSMKNEYEEAIEAGQFAQKEIKNAIDSLNKAKGWSTLDMFGGGMITTAVKHSHLDTAKDDIHEAQKQLRHFQEELQDLEDHFHANLDIGNFLTFADYFFNSLIVDWMVHGKITDSLEQIERAESQVVTMMNKLNTDHKEISEKLAETKKERRKLLESAT